MVLDVGTKRELFVDRHLIEGMEGATLTTLPGVANPSKT